MIIMYFLGALAMFAAGYLTCAIRVAILRSEELDKDDK